MKRVTRTIGLAIIAAMLWSLVASCAWAAGSVNETWIRAYNPTTKRYATLAKGWLLSNYVTSGNQSITGNSSIGGTLAVTGISTFTGSVRANGGIVRPIAAPIAGATQVLTTAAYPSGSVLTCSAATVAVTLPALTAGTTYTIIMLGATSFTLTGPSACVLCDGQTAAKTNLVWSTTPLYLTINVVSTASNWVVTSMTTAPDSSS